MMNIDSLLLDIDGTLWDTSSLSVQAYSLAIHQYSDFRIHITQEMIKREYGKPLPAIADDLFPSLPSSKRIELIQRCDEVNNRFIQNSKEDFLYPGVHETIAALSSELPLFIISNCYEDYAVLFIEKNGLSPFIKDYACINHIARDKASNIKYIIETYHLKNPIYIGDIEADRIAAEQGGAGFMHAAYGYGSVTKSVPELRSFSDILSFFPYAK